MGIADVFSAVHRYFCLKIGLALASLFVLATLSVAQVAPASTGGLGGRQLDAFATGSVVSSDYHQRHLWGYSFGTDYQIHHWLWIRGSLQNTVPRDYIKPKYPFELSEQDLFVGPMVKHSFWRITPYADEVAGLTHLTYPQSNYKDAWFGFALGGGVDFRVTRRFSIRAADIQWSELDPGSPPVRKPILYNGGLVFRIF